MGVVADAASAAGGEVVGVVPQHLVDDELARLSGPSWQKGRRSARPFCHESPPSPNGVPGPRRLSAARGHVAPTGRLTHRLAPARPGHRVGMQLNRTLAALMIAGSAVLTGCAGTNTDVTRGETDCDGGDTNTHDENCTQTGSPNPADNT